MGAMKGNADRPCRILDWSIDVIPLLDLINCIQDIDGVEPDTTLQLREYFPSHLQELLDLLKSHDVVVLPLTLANLNSFIVPFTVHALGLKTVLVLVSRGDISSAVPVFDFASGAYLIEPFHEFWRDRKPKPDRIRDLDLLFDAMFPIFFNNQCFRGSSKHDYMNADDATMLRRWDAFKIQARGFLQNRRIPDPAAANKTSAAAPEVSPLITPAVANMPSKGSDINLKIPDNPREVVVVVHGIRDIARWQSAVRETLESEGFIVELVNYGRMNLIEFLIPSTLFRRNAINEVWSQLQQVTKLNSNAKISVIAHSFGTYVIAQILKEQFAAKFDKIIFCGSVVRSNFPFEQVADRFSGPIINEVGTRDPWPALAESVSFAYGSAGTYGFRRPYVRDRYHNGAGHGYFLNETFCRNYWIPVLRSGKITGSSRYPENPRFWVSILSIAKIKYIIIALITLGIAASFNYPYRLMMDHITNLGPK
jgi:hypothetical protein